MTPRAPTGTLVLSLDFELYWGVRDKRSLADYGDHLRGVRTVLPRLLDRFAAHGIRATFATVGMLFARDREELTRYLPDRLPTYTDGNLSPYGPPIADLPPGPSAYHFAPDLVAAIASRKEHELATHTFGHYYCLEEGQTREQFAADLRAAHRIATDHGTPLTSIVLPRNQWNPAYRDTLRRSGITAYRGNETAWYYRPRAGAGEGPARRAFRLLDAHFNLSGPQTYPLSALGDRPPYNVPSSRFLRPCGPAPGSRVLERLRLARIRRAMTHAARHGEVYHLWWHPHNFGRHPERNFAFLERILLHYRRLHDRHGFESLTMRDLVDRRENSLP